MLASEIIDRARPILHDNEGVRWPQAELLAYISDAQHQIIEIKPTANAVTARITIQPNRPDQEIPENAQKMLRLVRNVLANDRPGRGIVLTSRAVMDAMNPEWPSEAGIEVEKWLYDPDSDRSTFWVYPSVMNPVEVEAVYSSLPDPVLLATDQLSLSGRYINQILDWVLFRAFSKDADYAGASQRSMQHLDAFATAMGVKMQQMMRTNPNLTRRGGETMGKT